MFKNTLPKNLVLTGSFCYNSTLCTC